MTPHPRIAELAALDLDFVLSPGDRAELEGHLAECGSCRTLLRAYRTDAEALRGDAFTHAPARVRSTVMSAASRPVSRTPFNQLLVAAAFVSLLLIGLAVAAGALRNEDRRLALATVLPTQQVTEQATQQATEQATEQATGLAPATSLATASASVTEASPSTPARSLTPTIAAAPANDSPPGIAILNLPFSNSTDTTLAQIHAMEPASVCGSGTQSVWYSYTAGQAATLVADTFGSGYDTILDIWTGSLTNDYLNPGFETLVPLVCNDNAGASVQSEVVFAVTPGVSYVIRVTTGSNTGGGGALTFHLALG
jgi:putative zinc finger protein